MKGQIKVKVEVTNEVGAFPITETWEYTRDNTIEGLEEWIDLFEKILVTQGFCQYKLDIVEEDSRGADADFQ